MKKLLCGAGTFLSSGTSARWLAAGAVTIMENTGQVPIRIDKLLTQLSITHAGSVPLVGGSMVVLSDVKGNHVGTEITEIDDTAFNAALDKWRDYIWMTDFRLIGTSSDESNVPVIPLEANTKRILEPGQKLLLINLTRSMEAAAKTCTVCYDYNLWYSLANSA